MRQVSAGKALAVGVLAVTVSAAISGGAVHMANRHKVAMFVPQPRELAAACAAVIAVHRNNPNFPVMLDPSIFRLTPHDSRIFFNIKPQQAKLEWFPER